ncbi:MAG: hypothetical protein AAF433_07730 [Bacteroidota bacterium]
MADQLLNLLDTLTEAEKNHWLEFLQSPYFNKRVELMRLGLAFARGIEGKEKLYEYVYSHQPYADNRWRLLKSDFLQLLEHFLSIYEPSRLDEGRRQLSLQSQLRKRQQDQRYAAAQRRIKRWRSDWPDGCQRAQLEYEIGWEDIQYKMSQRSMRVADFNRLNQQLERNYLLEALRLACHGLATQSLEPASLQLGVLPQLLASSNLSRQLNDDLVLALYHACYMMLSAQQDSSAFARFQFVLPQVETLSKTEARDLILLGINYCIRQVNAGDQQAGNAALDLYQFGFDQGYLLEAGYLSRFTFNNVVALALKAGAIKRAAIFIETYAERLSPTYRQSTTALNQARLAYEKGELDLAMEQLQSAKDQDVLTTLNIRVLQLRVSQQLAHQRLFDAQLDALDIYLRRRKDTLGYHYKAYRKLTKYLHKYRRLNPYDSKATATFKQEVKSAEGLPEKNWLLKLLA